MADNAQVINLLPDEKLKLLRVQRVNALVTASSAIVLVVCVAIIILLIGAIEATQFQLTQKKDQIKQLNNSIAVVDKLDDGTSLQARAAAIQAQLALISQDVAAKQKRQFVASLQRLIAIMPPTVNLAQASVDQTGTVSISGSARTYDDIGRFAQALKVDGTNALNPSSGASTASFFTKVTITTAAFSAQNNTYSYSMNYLLGSEANNVGQ